MKIVKLILLCFAWFLRIPFKILSTLCMWIGSWCATVHGICFLWELWCKDYSIILSDSMVHGIATHNVTHKQYSFTLLEGVLHEPKESQGI